MTEFLMEAVRWFIVAEMTALIWCSYLLHAAYSDEMPKRLRWMGRGMLWVAFSVGFAVAVNAFSDEPVTIGAYALAVLVLPVVIVGSLVTTHTLREAWAQHQAMKQAIADLDGLEPCPNPDCIRVRDHLKHTARLK